MAHSDVVDSAADQTLLRRAIGASVAGTVLEWYDFYIYGTAASLVLGALFFPEFSELAGTLAAFSTFAVGFFARPVGGIVFGHLGDKIGRKAVLVMTLLLMGVASTLIGLLPTYESIGVLAPIMLLVLRVCQGLAAGAEYSGASVLVTEYSPAGRRGFYTSLTIVGIALAFLLSSGIFAIFARLPEEQFLSWGWRVPFLLSVVLVAIGLYVRFRIAETPVFSEVKETHTEARLPVVEVIRVEPRKLLAAIGMRIAENASFYFFSVFAIAYITQQLDMANSVGLAGVVIASAIAVFAVPAYGALSDRVGRRPVYMVGVVFTALFIFPFFFLLQTKSSPVIWLAFVLALCLGSYAMLTPTAAYFCELFDTRVRYSGVALAREVSAVFAGGLAPVIATSLLAVSGGAFWPVAVYMIVLTVISFTAVYFAPETYRADIASRRLEEEVVTG